MKLPSNKDCAEIEIKPHPIRPEVVSFSHDFPENHAPVCFLSKLPDAKKKAKRKKIRKEASIA